MSTEPPPPEDDAWQAALEWLFQLDRAPDDAELQQAVATWRRARPANDRAFREAAAMWSAGRHVTPTTREKWPATQSEARRGSAARTGGPTRRHVRRRRLVAAALAASILLAGSYGWWRDIFVDHATGVGGTLEVALADRSRVRLDTDSAINLAFGKDRRAVELTRGRAFFAVRRDPARPFIVRAGRVSVRVLGTRFDVRRSAGAIVVRVIEGRVAVRTPNAATDGRGTLAPLVAGDRLRIDLAANKIVRDRLPIEAMAAWRRGRLVVDGWTVRQVIDEIARYHRGFIILRGDALAARRISGSFDITRPANAVHAVAAAFGARVRSATGYLLIVDGG